MKASWPADTDLPDTLVLGLTAHQLLLSAPGLVLFGVAVLVTILHIVPKWAGIVALVVIGGLTVALVIDSPDGMAWDRWLVALVRFRRAPRVQAVDAELAPLPSWVRAGGGVGATLSLPWGTPATEGVPLRRDKSRGKLGHALALSLSPLDHTALDGEGLRLVEGALHGWLTALDTDAQVLVRCRPLDLTGRIAHLEAQATNATEPALAAVAWRRAEELRTVAARRPQQLRAWLVLRHEDPAGLADRARRLTELLAGAGVEAAPVAPVDMA
ncbi:MAG: PrgI family protein, partial [Actinomycetota bacterium]